MGGPGGIPKDPTKRIRRNKETRETLPGLPVTSAAVREMPAGEWSPATMEWWATWCGSPQATRFIETDWRRLRMLVPVVQKFNLDCDLNCMREIRLSESLLGATPIDRLRLKWDLADAPAPARDELASRRKTRPVVDNAVAGEAP